MKRLDSNEKFRLLKKKIFGKNKTVGKWLCLDRMERSGTEGGGLVVKGVARRIIVVRSPDPKIFEQAIFIIREDFAGQPGVTERDVLRQARRAADEYMRSNRKGPRDFLARVRGPLYAAAGAAATGIAWLAIRLVHF